MPSRLLAILISYGLSGLGIVFSLAAATEGLLHPTAKNVVFGLLYYFAWSSHAIMSAAWLLNKRLHRFWPIAGTAAGVTCLVILPLFSSLSLMPVDTASAAIYAIIFQAIWVLPCIVLAIVLVRFHVARV